MTGLWPISRERISEIEELAKTGDLTPEGISRIIFSLDSDEAKIFLSVLDPKLVSEWGIYVVDKSFRSLIEEDKKCREKYGVGAATFYDLEHPAD